MEAKVAQRCGVCGHDHEQVRRRSDVEEKEEITSCIPRGHQVPHLWSHRQKPHVQVLQGGNPLYPSSCDTCMIIMVTSSCCFGNEIDGVYGIRVHGAAGQDEAVAGHSSSSGARKSGLVDVCQDLEGRIFPNMAKVLPDDRCRGIWFHLVRKLWCLKWLVVVEMLMRCYCVGLGSSWRWTDGCRTVAACLRGERQPSGHYRALRHHGAQAAAGYARKFPPRSRRGVTLDIEAIYANQPTHPQALVANVPQNDSFAAMTLFQSVGFQPSSQVELVEDSSFLRMRMAWGCRAPRGCEFAGT
ncbi:hypothetical protein GQ600_21193 [Phytophthora cactorum]|nr:hypothetical protein GQ600_21193 [Phytophthora cactorum]